MKKKTVLVWVLLIGLALTAYCYVMRAQDRPEEVSASSFMDLVERGEITKVAFTADDIVGARRGGQRAVKTRLHEQSHVIAALEERNVPYSDHAPPNYTLWGYIAFIAVIIVISVLPLLLIGRVLKKGLQNFMPGGDDKTSAFTKHKAIRVEGKTGKTMIDVAGIPEAKAEVQDFIDFLKDPKKFEKMGARMPKGAILQGPPGTGKTLLGKAVAGETDVAFFFVSAADFVEMYVGVGAARIRNLFEELKKAGRAILFIDEIDALSRGRGVASSGGNEEREATLNALLQALDGFDNSSGIIVFAATNRPEMLDKALLRPGRFDRIITVPNPDIKGREAILGIHVMGKPLNQDVDLAALAQDTPGMAGAGLEQLVNEACILAAKEGSETVTMDMFRRCVLRIRLGAPRRSMIVTADEKRATAVHEVGHVIAAWFNAHSDPVKTVTCIPHGPGLGWTLILPERDIMTRTREQLLAMIEIAHGGYAAEKAFLGTTTTGVENDLQHGTDIAEDMTVRFGMIDAIGPRSFVTGTSGFLNRELGRRPCGDEQAGLIDQSVNGLLGDSLKTVMERLESNRDKVLALIDLLCEKEMLDARQIGEVLGPRTAPEA